MEPQAVWRVYLPEWSIVYTSKARGHAGGRECRDVFAERYGGRVREGDWLEAPVSSQDPDSWEWTLQLRLPNRRGEFRDYADAAALAGELGGEARIVARFSDEEKQLLAYGTRLLHDGG